MELECEPDKRTNDYKLLQQYMNIINLDIKMRKASAINKKIGIVRNFYNYLLKFNFVYHNPRSLELTGMPAKGNVSMLSYTNNKKDVIVTIRVKDKKSFEIVS